MLNEARGVGPSGLARARRRQLRRRSTDAERRLWHLLRDRRLAQVKFRRQHPCGDYILDFYPPEHRLAIEADGGQHLSDGGAAHDRRWDRYLEESGIKVLRFTNLQVLRETEAVVETIWQTVKSREEPSAP